MRIVMPMPQSCYLLGCDSVACTPHPCFQQLHHSLTKSYSWQLFKCIPCLLCKQIYWPSHGWNSILIFFAYLLYLEPCLEIWQLGTAWYMVHGLGIYRCTHLWCFWLLDSAWHCLMQLVVYWLGAHGWDFHSQATSRTLMFQIASNIIKEHQDHPRYLNQQ